MKTHLTYNAETRRHEIDGVELHCGDAIDAKLGDDWFEGRYEATWHNPGEPRAYFYFVDKFGDERIRSIRTGATVARAGSSRELSR